MAARDRALQAVNRRLERVGEKEQLRRTRQQPTLYAGQGEVQPLGAAGGIPATRGIPTTGGLAVGQPVAVAQGLVQGPQDAPQRADLEAVAAQLLRLLGEVRNNRGIQLFSGDPNDSGAPAYQAFDYQILYRTDTGVLYYWEPGTAAQAGEWVEIVVGLIEEVNGLIEAPAVGSYTLIHSALYRSEVLGVTGSSGTNVSLNISVGNIIEIGDPLILSVVSTDGNPYSFTVGTRRIGSV